MSTLTRLADMAVRERLVCFVPTSGRPNGARGRLQDVGGFCEDADAAMQRILTSLPSDIRYKKAAADIDPCFHFSRLTAVRHTVLGFGTRNAVNVPSHVIVTLKTCPKLLKVATDIETGGRTPWKR